MPLNKRKRVTNAHDFAVLVSTIDRADLVASADVFATARLTDTRSKDEAHRKALDRANAILRNDHSAGAPAE